MSFELEQSVLKSCNRGGKAMSAVHGEGSRVLEGTRAFGQTTIVSTECRISTWKIV